MRRKNKELFREGNKEEMAWILTDFNGQESQRVTR